MSVLVVITAMKVNEIYLLRCCCDHSNVCASWLTGMSVHVIDNILSVLFNLC
jgi:hypothetical protein